MSHILSQFNHLKILLLVLSPLVLISCQQQDTTEEQQQTNDKPTIIEINDQNVEEFSIIFAEHYQLMLDELLHGFNEARNEDDSHVFVSYRNFHWTPKYIEKKEYYQLVLKKNQAYIARSPVKRLFDHFEQLIYIGLDLKHGLADNDETLLRKTFVIIDHDKQDIAAILKRIANSQP